MKLTNSQKQDIVTKITQSSTFSNARTSSSLLQYLYDSTTKNTHLKEELIDIEFYGKSEFTDKNNPRVRVNVYNLRKKLNSYYDTEGKADKWKLSIDKGQYKVSFTKITNSFLDFRQYDWFRITPYIALFVAIMVIIGTNITPRPQKIWRSLLTDKHNTILYVGDVFGAVGNTITGRKGWTRDYGINSFPEFYDYIKNNPALKDELKPSPFAYSSSMAAISVQKFQKYFQNYNQEFSIRFSTRTSASEIKEGNAIYIGTFWNKNKFINYFNQANPYCKIKERAMHISGHPKIEDNSYNIFSSNSFEEYAIVSKYPGPEGTEHFVFFSQHDFGVTATVDYFTNTDSLINFSNTYLKKQDYFTAVFKVTGQDRTDTNIQLEQVVAF